MVNIVLDEKVLQAKVNEIVRDALAQASQTLHKAAYDLDPAGTEEGFNRAYQSGIAEGLRQAKEDYGD